MPHVVVIGAGVIGLSAALRLQSDGHQVTIVARDFPGPSETVDAGLQIDYTSPWGGAHNRWCPPTNAAEEREHAMAVRTFAAMRALCDGHPEAGITFLRGVEYLEAPPPAYRTLTEARAAALGMPGFRLLGPDRLPAGVRMGFEYDTWCVHPMVYCGFLLRRFGFRGGRVVKRTVRDPVEVFELRDLGAVDAVVNASGNGFGDPNMFITRGQTCLVANACAATVTRQYADGTWSFSVPRNFDGGTVVGGTKEPDNWDPRPSAAVRATLLRNFAATWPPILAAGGGRFRVLADIVGRRPTRRGGMRLEREEVRGGKGVVVHAYGLGGRGYELSWGVAQHVSEMLSEHLGPGSSEAPLLPPKL